MNLWGDQINGSNTFDPGGLNVSMVPGDYGHVADSGITANDLMVVALANGVRRDISSVDTDMLRIAYD